MEYTQEEFNKLNSTLKEMGIDFSHIGQNQGRQMGESALPPMPASDPMALSRNYYNGFYGYRTQEFWGKSEVISHAVEDFKKCNHYFSKREDYVTCDKCHIGWTVPSSFGVQNGKLFDGETQLQFAP